MVNFTTYHEQAPVRKNIFLEAMPGAIAEFEQLCTTFATLATAASKKGKHGKNALSMWPILHIMGRQAAIAFENMINLQSFAAWATIRPCIEGALILGKWTDEPHNASIWASRNESIAAKSAYKKTFEGDHIISQSLPRSRDIKKVLSSINDDTMHLNAEYYDRHLTIVPGDGVYHISLSYIDDASEHSANVVALLHLLYVIQDSLRRMLEDQYSTSDIVPAALDDFEAKVLGREVFSAGAMAHFKDLMEKRGLWVI